MSTRIASGRMRSTAWVSRRIRCSTSEATGSVGPEADDPALDSHQPGQGDQLDRTGAPRDGPAAVHQVDLVRFAHAARDRVHANEVPDPLEVLGVAEDAHGPDATARHQSQSNAGPWDQFASPCLYPISSEGFAPRLGDRCLDRRLVARGDERHNGCTILLDGGIHRRRVWTACEMVFSFPRILAEASGGDQFLAR